MTGNTIVCVSAIRHTAPRTASVTPTSSHADAPISRSQSGAVNSAAPLSGGREGRVATCPSVGGRAPGRRDRLRRLDQREVAERLREVADLPAALDVVLLGEQAAVVAKGEKALERCPPLVEAPARREGADQPERARQ